MATVVDTVNELFRGIKGDDTTDSRSTVRVFLVQLESMDTDVIKVILADSNIPQNNDAHPNDSGIFVRDRDVKLVDDDDKLTWLVEVRYSNEGGGGGGGGSDPHPTDLPPVITFSAAQYTRVVEKAYQDGTNDGSSGSGPDSLTPVTSGEPLTPVFNSVGKPFDPPVVQEDQNLVITIQRNETTTDFDPDNIKAYRNTINSIDHTGSNKIAGVEFTKFQGRMRGITAQKMWDKDGDAYWAVTYDIEIREVTHIRQVLDAGYYYLQSGGGTQDWYPILDKGSPAKQITEPMVLNGSGGIGSKSSPVYRMFQTYLAADWSSLNLPEDE